MRVALSGCGNRRGALRLRPEPNRPGARRARGKLSLFDVFWTLLVFFLWVVWLWLFTAFADVFRRRDLSGGNQSGWGILTILLPFLGVFVSLVTQSEGMT